MKFYNNGSACRQGVNGLPLSRIKWEDKFGIRHPVSEMDSGHIQNCIIVLMDKQLKCDDYDIGDFYWDGRSADEWILIFRDELIRRGVI